MADRPTPSTIHDLIDQARGGDPDALGRLLDACRPYLLWLASREMDPPLKAKDGASDLVQDTFLRAHQGFTDFRGEGEPELLGWLRQILVHQLANRNRHYRDTAKRSLTRERPLDANLSDSPASPLPDPGPSPSSLYVRREQSDRMTEALGRLPEEYRRVLVWRFWDKLAFAEIGERLGRTENAAQKMWVRALERLQSLMEESADVPPPARR